MKENGTASQQAWQFFCRTGLPEAYLIYVMEKEQEER